MRFDVPDPKFASLELPYAVDNVLTGATLNGHAIDIGMSWPAGMSWPETLSSFGGVSLIRTADSAAFVVGVNVLQVTVHNAGNNLSPLGFYAVGNVTGAVPEPSPPPSPAPRANACDSPAIDWTWDGITLDSNPNCRELPTLHRLYRGRVPAPSLSFESGLGCSLSAAKMDLR